MASSNVTAEIRSYTKSQDSKLESLNLKYTFLIVIASAALTIGIAVVGWLLATGG